MVVLVSLSPMMRCGWIIFSLKVYPPGPLRDYLLWKIKMQTAILLLIEGGAVVVVSISLGLLTLAYLFTQEVKNAREL